MSKYREHKSHYDFWMFASLIPGLLLGGLGFFVGLLAGWFYEGLRAGFDIPLTSNAVEKSQPDGSEKQNEAKP